MSLTFLQSSPGATPVIVEGVIKAAPERVFRAWTEPDEIVKWFGPAPHHLDRVDVDLREGGAWRFAYADSSGEENALAGDYVAIEAGRRLAFTWRHEKILADGQTETTPRSQVTVTFEPRDGGTFVRLVHEAIKKEDARLGVGRGWQACFENLQGLVGEDDRSKAAMAAMAGR